MRQTRDDHLAIYTEENPRAYERYPGTGPRIDDYYAYEMLIEGSDSPEDVSERVDAFNSQLWSPSRSCLLCTSPPCAALLDEPYGVLTNQNRWPKHLGTDVARESVERWLLNSFLPRSGPANGARLSISGLWPLPIDSLSLQQEVTTWELDTVYDALMPFMPFEGEEYATLILVTRIRDTLTTIYGLSRWDEALASHRIADMRYVVSGSALLHSEVTKFLNHALHWWSQFEGRPLHGSGNAGRRKGEAGESRLRYEDGWCGARFEREWEAYETKAEMMNERPSKAGFAAHLGVDVKTLNVRIVRLCDGGELPSDFPRT